MQLGEKAACEAQKDFLVSMYLMYFNVFKLTDHFALGRCQDGAAIRPNELSYLNLCLTESLESISPQVKI